MHLRIVCSRRLGLGRLGLGRLGLGRLGLGRLGLGRLGLGRLGLGRLGLGRLGLFSAVGLHNVLLWLTAICLHNCLTTNYRASAQTIYNFPGPCGWLGYVAILLLLGGVVGVPLSVAEINWATKATQVQRLYAWAGLVLHLLLLPSAFLMMYLLSTVFHIDFD